MSSIQISSQPALLDAPADLSGLGGVPVPVGSIMFGVQDGKIYRFSESNDSTDRDYLEGGLEFYGLKAISRWSTESAKYGILSYVRFHLVSPYKGVTYCLQLSDGANRNGNVEFPPAHIRGLTQSFLKAMRMLKSGNSLALVPGVIAPKQGTDYKTTTFLNLFVGPDPYDTNSLTQVFCEENERIEKTFEALDIAIDELCAHLGQETPSAADADALAEDAAANAAADLAEALDVEVTENDVF